MGRQSQRSENRSTMRARPDALPSAPVSGNSSQHHKSLLPVAIIWAIAFACIATGARAGLEQSGNIQSSGRDASVAAAAYHDGDTGGLVGADPVAQAQLPARTTSRASRRSLASAQHISRFWQQLAQCETGSRWDWGKRHRPGEGHTYEGGLGFYYATWDVWRVHVGVRVSHAYEASPAAQVRVARYGLAHGGYWGCLH